MPLRPHLRLPLRLLSSGEFETVEQDSVQEVAQHAAVVLRTPLGSRVLRDTMGLEDPTHRLANDGGAHTLALVEQQLAEHEPRAEHHASTEGATTPEWIERVTVDIVGVASDG